MAKAEITPGAGAPSQVETKKRGRVLNRREFLGWLAIVSAGVVGTKFAPSVMRTIYEQLGMSRQEAAPLAETGAKIIKCDINVIEDLDPKYDINIEEVRRILEDNNVECPYMLDIKIRHQPIRIEESEKGTLYQLGKHDSLDLDILQWHTISVYIPEETILETPGHDYLVVSALSGAEKGNWVYLHDLYHMILLEKGVPHDTPEAELQCDQFANENYQKYQVVVEQK
jgi:hypothetical protein